MKTIALLLAASAMFAEDGRFRVQLSRWSNHDVPAIIKSFLPPAQPKLDGIMAVVTVANGSTPEAIEVTLSYRTKDGKRMKQVRTAILATTGCTPEPCRWAPILFDVGVVESITATVQEWVTE